MFHLLVSAQGWSWSGGSIPIERTYIFEGADSGLPFLQNGIPNLSQINEFPALLVTEPDGYELKFAVVAHITNVAVRNRETLIEYVIDREIAPISNDDLEELIRDSCLGRFGLSHTHWCLCELDLFKILLLNQQKESLRPKVFSIDAINNQDSNLVSVMMPFKAEFSGVYLALQASIEELGLRCIRGDDIWDNHSIMQDVVDIIAKARIVICDCSGKNPNVFYEAGIAHTLGKEVILLTQADDDIPFDLRHLRYIKYLRNNEGLESLHNAVQKRVRNIMTNPQH